MPTPKLPTPLTTTTTMTMIQVQLTGIRPCGGEAATGATGTMMDIIHPGPRRRRRHGHVAGGAGFGRAARLRLRHGTVRRVFKKELRAAGEGLVGVSRTQEQGGWNGLLSPFREQGGWSCLLSASFNGKEARTLSGLLVRLLAYHKIIIAMMTIRSLTEL